MKKTISLLILAIALSPVLWANNLQISNTQLSGQNTTNHTIQVSFDLAWENSWRTSTYESNWDAAWVFIKYRVGVNGEWQHAWLSETGHVNPAGSSITSGLRYPESVYSATTNPALGSFIYRDADGIGNFSLTGVELQWNYGANGLADADSMQVKIMGIEMVYVPQGAFYVGSGGSEVSAFYEYPTTTNAYNINSEGEITVGTNVGNLYYPSSTYGGDQTGPVPATFPKGYNAFYCMKYEISQAQYVDFLNTLTQTQATERKGTYSDYRYGISGSEVGSYTTTNPYVACNYLSWADGAAYADWAGLRPMSELEFEKACRGNQSPVANEYAWDHANIHGSAYTLTNTGAANEGISNMGTGTGNASYITTDGSIDGPLRCGIFAASAGNKTREETGATYYGIMEMSGNLWERSVTIGNSTGRAYTGLHGNGQLSTAGDADENVWPGTNATGAGFRGGAWVSNNTSLRTSDRFIAAITINFRLNVNGFRCVRSVP